MTELLPGRPLIQDIVDIDVVGLVFVTRRSGRVVFIVRSSGKDRLPIDLRSGNGGFREWLLLEPVARYTDENLLRYPRFRVVRHRVFRCNLSNTIAVVF